MALLFVAAVLTFLVQNADSVRVSWLAWRVRAPLWVVTFIAAAGAGLVSAFIAWRRRPSGTR